jgi:hypothetical protein
MAMKNKYQAVLCVAALLGASSAFAGGYTSSAVPTNVELVNGGLLVSGAFGDPAACSVANYVFISQANTNYKEVVAMTYMAFVAGKSMTFYADSCAPVSFHWGAGNVINKISDGHAVSVQ